MKTRSKIIIMLLTISLVVSNLYFGAIAASDIAEGQWYTDAIRYVVENDIMAEAGADKFSPNSIVTRAVVFQSLYNIEGAPDTTGSSFADVSKDDWFCDAAAWAKETGLTKGSDPGFEGNRAITRAELADAFSNYMNIKGMLIRDASLTGFVDSETIPEWAQASMKRAVGAGIIKGTDEGKLNPNGQASYAELAQIHYNFSPLLSDSLTGVVTGFDNLGNFLFSILNQNLYNAGLEVYDTVTLYIGKHAFDGPMITAASMVDNGDNFLYLPGQGTSTRNTSFAINFRNVSYMYPDVKIGDSVRIELKSKGGHKEEYEFHKNLDYTNNREDFASDEIFANFRNVTIGNFAEGVFYRSCSPVDNQYGRAAYANALAEKHGIAAVVNITDSEKALESHFKTEGFKSDYYKGLYENGKVACLEMDLNPVSDAFKSKMKQGFELIIENEGPYLLHCTEGKDRAGYMSALLEALMGATLEEIKADYLVTFMNYYGVEYDSAQYHHIGDRNIVMSLRTMAGLEDDADLTKIDLQKMAEGYLINEMGMTQKQVDSLKLRLSTPIETAAQPAA